MTRIRTHRLGTHALASAALLLSGLVVAGAPDYLDLRRIEALHGDAAAGKANASVCGACHGMTGISTVPAFPNLAGQHAEYLYWQLLEFKREARLESPMTAQVATLDVAGMRDLAAYFESLPAANVPVNRKPESADHGGILYREGDPARGVPPCQGCHGVDGSGHPLANENAHWRAYPVLRGQHADYLTQRLKDFRDGKHTLSSNDRIMTPIAQSLDDASIEALARWLESALQQSVDPHASGLAPDHEAVRRGVSN